MVFFCCCFFSSSHQRRRLDSVLLDDCTFHPCVKVREGGGCLILIALVAQLVANSYKSSTFNNYVDLSFHHILFSNNKLTIFNKIYNSFHQALKLF